MGDKESDNKTTDRGQGQPPNEVLTLPPTLYPSRVTSPDVGKQYFNKEAFPRWANRLPVRYRDFLLH